MNDADRGLAACRAGRLDEAEQICRQVLAGEPSSPPAISRFGDAMLRAGRLVEAEALAAFALAAAPGQPDLLTTRGAALAKLGRDEEALACLVEATDRRLTDPTAHRVLDEVLARRGDATPRFSVSVITPSIGGDHLTRAIAGVQEQTYPFVEHFIVADGPQYHERVRAALPRQPNHPVNLLPLPFNIGAGKFNGHRAYGAAPYLVNGRYVAFLDEDNWFDADHIASLMARITAQGLAWAYALRRIVDRDGKFIVEDNCESLGRWPVWDASDKHLVDANCYLVRRDAAIALSRLWYCRVFDDQSPDFTVCEALLKDYPRCGTNGRSTVSYRVGMTALSVRADYFLKGNEAMRGRYGNAFPWREQDLEPAGN